MALPFEGLDRLADIQQLREAAQRPAQVQQMQMPSPDAGLQSLGQQEVDVATGVPVGFNPSDAMGQVINTAGQYAMANPQKTGPFAAALAAFGAGSEAANMIDNRVSEESEREDLSAVKDMAQGLPDRTKTVMPTTTMRQNIPFEIQKEVQVSEVAPNIMTMREGGRISSEQLKPLLDMGVPENELKEIIFKESSGNPRAVNPSSNAVGLFQFTESAIKDLNKFKNTNITKDEILKMSVPKQVDLYKKYLERWRWKPGTSLGVLQAAPGFANRAKDTVIYKKGSNAAKLNKQWQDSAGNITVKSIEDFYDFASGKSKKGKQPLIEAGEVKAPSKVTPLIQDKKPEQTTIKTPTKKESKDTGFVESAKEVGSGLLNLLGRDYTVEKGDTLSAIAEKSGVSVEDLLESNPNIVDRDKISIGQEVDIPNFKSFVGKFKDAFGLKEGGDVGKYFEGQVEGEGDGMSDEITFRVEGGNPDYALLSKDEYVLPADVVSMLGNGSSDAGSDELDQFVKDTRKQAFGREEQQTQIDPEEGLSSLV